MIDFEQVTPEMLFSFLALGGSVPFVALLVPLFRFLESVFLMVGSGRLPSNLTATIVNRRLEEDMKVTFCRGGGGIMKRFLLILVLVFAISLPGADFTITVTVPDATVTDVLATVNAWRVRQVDENGDPIYANNNELGQAILYQGLRRILRQQCEFDPNTCVPTIKSAIDARNTAERDRDSRIDAAVQP